MQLPTSNSKLSVVKKFPVAPWGYETDYSFKELDLEVTFNAIDQNQQKISGRINFISCFAICIEAESNNTTNLPPRSDTLYSFDSVEREGFRGFQIWFSDDSLITVACRSVMIGNEEY